MQNLPKCICSQNNFNALEATPDKIIIKTANAFRQTACYWESNHFKLIRTFPVLHHCAGYILISFWVMSPFWFLWKSKTAKAGIYSRKLHSCMWRVLIKPSLPFSFFRVVFGSKGNHCDFYFLISYNKANVYIIALTSLCNVYFHICPIYIMKEMGSFTTLVYALLDRFFYYAVF